MVRSSCRLRLFTTLAVMSLLFSGCALSNPPAPISKSSTSGGPNDPQATGMPPGVPKAIKIYTTQGGIYEISASDLENLGLDIQNDRLATIKLFHRGAPVPLWFKGRAAGELPATGAIYFYALPSSSPYTSKNVYWLVQGDAPTNGGPWSLQTNQQDPLPLPQPLTTTETLAQDSYFATTRMEQNQLYTPQVEKGDHWLWLSMAAPGRQTVDLTLKDLVSGPGRIRISLWARTEAPPNPDHDLTLSVNDQAVSNQTWDGKGRYQFDASIPSGVLQKGSNKIELSLESLPGVTADLVSLDWIELGYPRQLVPEDDRLDFTSAGGKIILSGFSGRTGIFDISKSAEPELVSVQEGKGGTLESLQGHRYLVVGSKGFLHPDKLVAATGSPDLRAAGMGADYVAVGPADLLQPLQPLLDFHQQNGLKVASIPVDAVYDQFGSGFPEPQAIRDFMKYASQTWKPVPHYLLLVGDATYDPRGYQSPAELNRLPTFMVSTVYGGETASDVNFSQLDQDEKPDIAVGRIPAARPEQVSILVQKTLAFEKSAQQSSASQTLLAVADGQDPIFQSDAQNFLDLFPSNYQTELIAPPAGTSGADQQIIDRLKQGDLLVAYFGHGSLNMWGKDRLFTTQDVAALKDMQHLPVVLNFTCLTGLFTHPKIELLAETMLWQPGGGAVAALAPTSLTLPTDQSFLYKPFVQAMLGDPSGSLGDFLLSARRQVPTDAPGRRDVMETFLLLGDPALQLMPDVSQ